VTPEIWIYEGEWRSAVCGETSAWEGNVY